VLIDPCGLVISGFGTRGTSYKWIMDLGPGLTKGGWYLWDLEVWTLRPGPKWFLTCGTLSQVDLAKSAAISHDIPSILYIKKKHFLFRRGMCTKCLVPLRLDWL
jgi:hypothetical protein